MSERRRRRPAGWYTTFQVAGMFGVSIPTVVTWIDGGLLPGHRTAGGHRRVARNDLVAFARLRGVALPQDVLAGDGGKPRVLVVDDETDFAELLREYLVLKGGLEVEVASTAFTAGFSVARFKPDVILLDLTMRDLDAFDVHRQLRADPETRHIPVVACSAYRDPAMDERVKEQRFDAFVEKPIKLENLMDVLLEQVGALDD